MQTEQYSSPHITGDLFIGHRRETGMGEKFHGFNPVTGLALPVQFGSASNGQIDKAANLASDSFDEYRSTTGNDRAKFLESIANGIEALGQSLLELTHLETGLPLARLKGERARTTDQLRMFANVARKEQWVYPCLPKGQPREDAPALLLDLHTRYIPLGPVAVFGASNFPYAFSVAGGDTASALAIGCPVIVKAHPSHPGTSEMIGAVIQNSAIQCGMPAGVFSMIAGNSHHIGGYLTSHPEIKAIAFTGSRQGGIALCKLAQQRAAPIPVFAEMSAINPVFLMPHALQKSGPQIAKGFIDSLALGAGQFCTNPGLIVGIKSDALKTFTNTVAVDVIERLPQPMLNQSIYENYQKGLARLSMTAGVSPVGVGKFSEDSCSAQVRLFQVSAEIFMANGSLSDEVFGPSALLVQCDDLNQLITLASTLEGQLTATIHLSDADHEDAKRLIPILERKSGRIVINDFPTGVAVADAMVHGGPFPATSDARSTSVGSRAIERFIRPICYQNFPNGLRPVGMA
jgi:2,5-dioxopentanoate dehydrogenase